MSCEFPKKIDNEWDSKPIRFLQGFFTPWLILWLSGVLSCGVDAELQQLLGPGGPGAGVVDGARQVG